MASNLIVARGGVEYVPPISLAFWRWTVVFLILLPFTYLSLRKSYKIMKKEYKKLFFLGATGCGVCGAFPFLAGQTTTVTNMGIIYTSSPIFIILISSIFLVRYQISFKLSRNLKENIYTIGKQSVPPETLNTLWFTAEIKTLNGPNPFTIAFTVLLVGVITRLAFVSLP